MSPRSTLDSHDDANGLKLQTDPPSSKLSYRSSPESQPVDLRSPIVEEEEEETSSEAAEPGTPTDSHHLHNRHMNDKANSEDMHGLKPIMSKPPPIVNTTATLPTPARMDMNQLRQQTSKTYSAPEQERPTASTVLSKDGIIKRGLSGLFKRSNAQHSNLNIQPMTQVNGSDPMLGREQRRITFRRVSATASAYNSRSNTPPSPGSPAVDSEQQSVGKGPRNDTPKHSSCRNIPVALWIVAPVG